MAVTFEDAIRKSMRAYWINTRDYDAMTSNKGQRKFTKKYFDDIEETMIGKKAKDKKELEEKYK